VHGGLSVWRLCKAQFGARAFDGEGARRYGGRWNPVGTAVVYCAGSLSLATLEALVAFGRSEAPADMVSIRVEIPGDVPIEHVDPAALPRDWRAYPAPEALAAIGRTWLLAGRTAVLAVPSAITPTERNYVIDPAHPQFQRLVVHAPEPFSFDPRLLGDV